MRRALFRSTEDKALQSKLDRNQRMVLTLSLVRSGRTDEAERLADEASRKHHWTLLCWGYITGPLARLQLGPAEGLMGDNAPARESYEEFLNILERCRPPIFPSIDQPKPTTPSSKIGNQTR